jgi:hypothetical protein
MANLGPLRADAALLEFDLQHRSVDVVEAILARNPKIVGLGVYIWNVSEITRIVATLKRVRPDVTVILGGPEVSHEAEDREISRLADYVISGEADLKFAEVCRQILAGTPPPPGFLRAEPPDLAQLALPYDLYTAEDVAHRVIYVEASRGCPFSCEFCLSSLDVPVRQFPLPALLREFQRLLDRGVHQFKFADRSFNLDIAVSKAILQFFLERLRPGLFVHLEMIPDRLPDDLRDVIVQFPPGTLQFEVGVQTFNETVARNIRRRQDFVLLEENLRFLRERTGVHVHADLIAGLPGESWESFAAGFDRLVELGPQEIQVGILKRLPGAPIARHDQTSQMVYAAHPPYELLRNNLLDFQAMQRLRRFARHWDLVGNSGNFVDTTPMIWNGAASPFAAFMAWSQWLHGRATSTSGIALARLAGWLFEYLTKERGLPAPDVAQSLWRDWRRAGRREKPEFLAPYLSGPDTEPPPAHSPVLKRQARHLAKTP